MKTMRKISVVVLMFYYTTGVFGQPFPEREKGELSLEFCCYKDTFGAAFFLIKEHEFSYREQSPPVSDWKRLEKMDCYDPIMISAGLSGTGFFTGSLCSDTLGGTGL